MVTLNNYDGSWSLKILGNSIAAVILNVTRRQLLPMKVPPPDTPAPDPAAARAPPPSSPQLAPAPSASSTLAPSLRISASLRASPLMMIGSVCCNEQ
jgi:hypothetical protein